MGDAIQVLLDGYDPSASAGIPVQRPALHCCCGDPACTYLKHNQSALAGLEKDVCTAARLGKALLMRHEAYIADSERERKAMTAHIEELESEKLVLEQKNANAIEENRGLLDQLERVNNAVVESDTHVTNLQATLRSTQQELHRLSSLSARTERLEQQLIDFETEQLTWQTTLEEKELSEKSATRRWQQAERTLADLQDQIERIELEAREEKERHVEVLGRMERKHAVERELDSAAGRLKGAAAVKTAGTGPGNTNVVSHFVKDILQDNANLQMGIIELRDMLQMSNEEVESLRKQISLHQPLPEDEEVAAAAESTPSAPAQRPHLKEEMRRATAGELHVHHHYHAPPPSAPKPTTRRSRSKKKRYGALGSGQYTPPSGSSTPRHSFSQGSPSTTAAILSHTAASLPEAVGSKRWSLQSNQTYQSIRDFSGPSSPGSTHHASSVFDRVFSDAGHDSSRPTTPDTEEPGSPVLAPLHPKRSSKSSSKSSSYRRHRPSSSSHRARPSLDSIMDMSTESLRHAEQTSEAAIPEEDEHDWENASSQSPERESDDVNSPFSEELDDGFQITSHPQMRRSKSHESIISFSGMDIHTLKSRPSQLLIPHGGGRSFAPQAVVSAANVHAARPAAVSSQPMNSGASILSGMASAAAAQRHASAGYAPTAAKQGLGSKMGGWVFGRWGASPTPSSSPSPLDPSSSLTPKANRAPSIASGSTAQSDDQTTPKKPPAATKHRPPGINQAGPILGFAPETKLQHSPIMQSFDEDALKRVLGDGKG